MSEKPNIYPVLSGMAKENCFIYISDKKSEKNSELNKGLIIDPGFSTKKSVLQKVQALNVEPVAILLTHGHFDHLWDAQKLSEKLGNIPVYGDKGDKDFFADALKELGGIFRFASVLKVATIKIPNIKFFESEQWSSKPMNIEGIEIDIHNLPGHSQGSTIFTIEETKSDGSKKNIMFSGDVIFAQNSIGRVDIFGSDVAQMEKSLKYLKTLQDAKDYWVYPGHGNGFMLSEHNLLIP